MRQDYPHAKKSVMIDLGETLNDHLNSLANQAHMLIVYDPRIMLMRNGKCTLTVPSRAVADQIY